MSNVKTNICICFCVAAAAIGIYAQTGCYGVVLWEETQAIADYHDGFTIENIKRAFGGPSTNMAATGWGPVSFVACMIDAELFGGNPGPRHLVNLLLHAGSAVLLFLVLVQSTRQSWPSGFVALLFAVHPLNVESVAWLAVHDTSLSTFFIMLGLAAYLAYTRQPGLIRYLPVMLCLLLGLMSKPTIVFFPCLLILLDYWPLRRPYWGAPRRIKSAIFATPVLEKIPLFFLAFLWVVATRFFYNHSVFAKLEIAPVFSPSSVLSFLPSIPVSYVSYIGKVFYPVRLVPDRLAPPHCSSLSQAAFSLILLAVITGLAFMLARRRHRYALMGWLWFILAMFPGVVMNAAKNAVISDRYAYIGTIGLFIAVVWSVREIILQFHWKKKVVYVVCVSVIPVFMVMSWHQAQHWQNSTTMLKNAIRLFPDHQTLYAQLGDRFYADGQKPEALAAYFKALQLAPASPPLYNSIGVVQRSMGNIDEAIVSFKKALELGGGYMAYYNLGNAFLDEGKVHQAIGCFKEALQINPSLPNTHNALAIALAYNGQLDGATYHFEEALKIYPHYSAARENLEVIRASLSAGQNE